jgi:hypothetical protein
VRRGRGTSDDNRAGSGSAAHFRQGAFDFSQWCGVRLSPRNIFGDKLLIELTLTTVNDFIRPGQAMRGTLPDMCRMSIRLLLFPHQLGGCE